MKAVLRRSHFCASPVLAACAPAFLRPPLFATLAGGFPATCHVAARKRRNESGLSRLNLGAFSFSLFLL